MPAAEIVLEFEGESFLGEQGARAGLILLGGDAAVVPVHPHERPADAQPEGAVVAGQRRPEGGLHVHHLVFGHRPDAGRRASCWRCQPGSPWLEILAGGFGIGAGLTLDEYALWLHLEDVYWAEEGRRSVDAVVVARSDRRAAAARASCRSRRTPAIVTLILSVLVTLGLSTIAVLKGKVVLGLAGMLLPPLALIGALRLAKPDSPWGRRRYQPGSAKLARCTARAERHRRRYQRFQDRIAGAPD